MSAKRRIEDCPEYADMPEELKAFAELDPFTDQVTFINSKTKGRPDVMRRGVMWVNQWRLEKMDGESR